jgi:carbamoyl-phosphate synthase small subunit
LRHFDVVLLPWNVSAKRILELEAKGVVISNGPGDPKQCKPTVEAAKGLMGEIPILGICLGNQILGLACGGDTYKLKYGHRGQNKPCIDLETKRCYITSQNHGYAVDAESLPEDVRVWFMNADDKSVEGLVGPDFISVQFHPEACPGPLDTQFVFDRFSKMVRG